MPKCRNLLSEAEREEKRYWDRQEHAPRTMEERIKDSIIWYMTEDLWEVLREYAADDDLCAAVRAILAKKNRTPEEERFYKEYRKLAEKMAEFVVG